MNEITELLASSNKPKILFIYIKGLRAVISGNLVVHRKACDYTDYSECSRPSYMKDIFVFIRRELMYRNQRTGYS